MKAVCPVHDDGDENSPALHNAVNATYCDDDKTCCARYLVYRGLGADRVPDDLRPEDHKKACFLIIRG